MPRADTVHNVINFAPTHCPALPPNAFLPCLRHFSPLSTTRLSLVRDFTIMDDDFDTSMSITRPLRPQHKKASPDIFFYISHPLSCFVVTHLRILILVITSQHANILTHFHNLTHTVIKFWNRITGSILLLSTTHIVYNTCDQTSCKTTLERE